jgi:hypothetical protein
MELFKFLEKIVGVFEQLKIPYLVTGAVEEDIPFKQGLKLKL